MSSQYQRRQFPFWLGIFQVIFIVIFKQFAHFNDHALPNPNSKVYVNTDYPLFQDIHVMSLTGFGFLMAFLKRYGFAAVSMNLLMCAFVSQWAMIIRGFLSTEFRESWRFTISIEELMTADLSCTPVLISMGALIGRAVAICDPLDVTEQTHGSSSRSPVRITSLNISSLISTLMTTSHIIDWLPLHSKIYTSRQPSLIKFASTVDTEQPFDYRAAYAQLGSECDGLRECINDTLAYFSVPPEEEAILCLASSPEGFYLVEAQTIINEGSMPYEYTPMQFVLMSVIETAVCTITEHLILVVLHCNDGGRSLVTHAFGAYFGLACARTARQVRMISKRGTIRLVGEDAFDNESEDGIEHSELFSIIGTLFLWIFFPSFNAAAQEPEDARHRAIINTYLSMASCTVFVFMATSMTDKDGRFNMIHIQSSSLAGGVAIGSVANAILQPWHSLLIGCIAAIISVLGHSHIQPFLRKSYLGLSDTCGVHNLHGLPGLLSGACSILIVLINDPSDYGDSLYKIYPYFKGGPRQGDRDKYSQAMYQCFAIIIVLATAVVSGVFTGLLLRLRCVNQMNDPTGAHAENADRAGFYYGHPDEVTWRNIQENREMQLRLRNASSQDIY